MADAGNSSAKGPTAIDIVTYVGFALTVLAVIPIFYIYAATLHLRISTTLTLRRNLKSIGVYAYVKFQTHAVLGQITTTYLPYRLETPLVEEPLLQARKVRRSVLPGGSWTALPFRVVKEVRPGRHARWYRPWQSMPDCIDENDSEKGRSNNDMAEFEESLNTVSYQVKTGETMSLRQRPGLIDFGDLIAFLDSLGAVADEHGLQELFVHGTATGSGTVLMRAPTDARERLLFHVRPNEVELQNSLALALDTRGLNKLPLGPNPFVRRCIRLSPQPLPPLKLGDAPKLYRATFTFQAIVVRQLYHGNKAYFSARFRDGSPGPSLDHLSMAQNDNRVPGAGAWFALAASAITHREEYPRPSYFELDGQAVELIHGLAGVNDVVHVPCRILSDLFNFDATRYVHWKPENAEAVAMAEVSQQKRPGHREEVIRDALASAKWSIRLIADEVLVPWLRQQSPNEFINLSMAAEEALLRMLLLPAEAEEICKMIVWWCIGMENGLSAREVQYIAERKSTFALTACLLTVMRDYLQHASAKMPDYLRSCLKKYEDVLLY